MELVLQISDIPLLIFGDSQITLIFAQKKVSLNFRLNLGTYYVLQIFVIPLLILVTVQSLRFSQKDEVHLHFRK